MSTFDKKDWVSTDSISVTELNRMEENSEMAAGYPVTVNMWYGDTTLQRNGIYYTNSTSKTSILTLGALKPPGINYMWMYTQSTSTAGSTSAVYIEYPSGTVKNTNSIASGGYEGVWYRINCAAVADWGLVYIVVSASNSVGGTHYAGFGPSALFMSPKSVLSPAIDAIAVKITL